ncbi:putative membrane protein YfcA [Inhella inkyongensis]|uniref:Probable membrane transporter protein n=1 Tax=Inhella inkyongensis TaxID=392593 RepID=A0A840S940_9BURK|nr:sulfite exporter TauE/SafE family protein [Inhella inkyongensis]MBB5205304.1 putative membrane protein YfcA [Inhella inkyongensis]
MSDGTILGLVALGLSTGLLAGLMGIGGGMLMVPALTALLRAQGVDADLSVKMAIATSMACIVGTSASSLRAHHRRGQVRWDVWRALAPGVLVGGLLSGATLLATLRGQWLAWVFAAFVGLSALQMWRGARSSGRWDLPRPFGLGAAGAGIGLVSGLVGAGGGFLSVPFLTACRVSIHQAVATSAALGLPIALANSAGYWWGGRHLGQSLPGAQGFFYLPALIILMPLSMLAAPLGARLAHALPVVQLRRGFALLLLGLAASMI